MKHLYLILLSLITLISYASAQVSEEKVQQPPQRKTAPSEKDDPLSRSQFEIFMYQDPQSGKIPSNIRSKELAFTQKRFPNKGVKSASGWKRRGPFNVGGRTRALALDLNDENIILAGGASGGLWRSTDQGLSWTLSSDPADLAFTITDIVQDPRPGFRNIWYYSTGESGSSAGSSGAFLTGNGIYKSVDGGQSWNQLASTSTDIFFNETFDFCRSLVIDPSNGDVYVATFFSIQRSQDGGSTWESVLNYGFNNSNDFTEIEISPSGIFYATIGFDPSSITAPLSASPGSDLGTGILRSTDGENWVNITPATFQTSYQRMVLGIAPSNENIIYLLAANTNSGAVDDAAFWKYTYLSGDGSGAGGNWVDLSANLPEYGAPVGDLDTQGNYNLICRVHPYDPNIVFFGGTNLYRTKDGLSSKLDLMNDPNKTAWVGGYATANNVSQYSNQHPDQHSMVFFPSDGNKMISGHDGGLSFTDNNLREALGGEPIEWTFINNGYLSTQFYTLHISPIAGDDFIFGGKQDNGSFGSASPAANAQWQQYGSGDGSFGAIAPNVGGTEKSFIIESRQNGSIFKKAIDHSSNQTTDFTRVNPDGASGYLFINPLILDENDPNIMYLPAGEFIWRNSDLSGIPLFSNNPATDNWTQLMNSQVSGETISALAVSTSNPSDRLYYATASGAVFRIDGANTGDPMPTSLSATGTSGFIRCIAVNPDDGDELFVVYTNYNVNSIYHSIDAGANWTSIGGNLDGVNGPSVRWLSISKTNPRTYYLATSTGLYSTSTLNGASTVWNKEGATTIGDAICNMVQTRSDGLVSVATHANGIYEDYIDADAPPQVLNEIEDFQVPENAPDTELDISNVFFDPDGESVALSIDNNTNPGLVNASLNANTLTLSYSANSCGVSTITLRGEGSGASAGISVFTSFTVTVGDFDVLDDQANDINNSGFFSGQYSNLTYSLRMDDFIVPLGEEWKIKSMTIPAFFSPLDDTPNLDAFTLQVYADNGAGEPDIAGGAIYDQTMSSENLLGASIADADIQVFLSPSLTLGSGTYWFAARPVFLNSAGSNAGDIHWVWRTKNTPINSTGGSLGGSFSTLDDFSFQLLGNTIPPVPSDLVANAQAGVTQINLTWTDNASSEIGFEIQRQTGAQSFSTIAILAPNRSSYNDFNGLAPNTTYNYRIRALGESANSEYVGPASATTDAGAISLALENQMLDLDGTGDYLALNNESNFDFENAFSLEFWMKSGGAQKDNATLVSKGNAWSLQKDGSTNDLLLTINGLSPSSFSFLASNSNVFDGGWHHIAASFTSSQVTIFVDGVANTSTLSSGTPSLSNDALWVGANSVLANREFLGQIDELRFWQSARNRNQIRENLRLGIQDDPDLISNIKMGLVSNDGFEFDAQGANAGTFNGDARLITALTPFGERGLSERKAIPQGGLSSFDQASVELDFDNAEFPNGEVVISRLFVNPNGSQNPDGFRVVEGYWIIDNYGGDNDFSAAPASSLFSSLDLDINYQMNPNLVNLYRREGNSDDVWSLVGAAQAGDNQSLDFDNLNGFSQFDLASNSAPLPIRLVRFESQRNAQNLVELNWTSISEINARGYSLEKSGDAQLFNAIAFVEAKGGASQRTDYHFRDPNSADRPAYYRLKLLNNDGSFEYSQVIYSRLDRQIRPLLYPNPSAGEVFVQDELALEQASKISWSIHDEQGKEIGLQHGDFAQLKKYLGQTFPRLSPGLYFMTIRIPGQVYRQKIVRY